MNYYESFIDENGHTVIQDIAILPRNFRGCNRLKSIEIPDGVMEIGEYAFYGCTGLKRIELPDSVMEIRSHAFDGCTGITSIMTSDIVTVIGDCVFWGCTCLTSIKNLNFGDKISFGTFAGCTSLKSIIIPNDVAIIGDYAFSDCKGLACIEIPDYVREIEFSAFGGCTGLVKISVSEGNKYFCSEDNCCLSSNKKTLIFGCKTSIIPESVTKIGDGAFYGCTGLTNIEIPDSVTEIGMYAFKGCTGLTNIEIPDSVTEIEEGAFEGCTGLTSIEIPDSVTEIGERAFSGCTGLTCITILREHLAILDEAFEGCSNVSDIYIGSKDPSNNKQAINNILRNVWRNQVTLHVPIGTGYAYRHRAKFGPEVKEIIADFKPEDKQGKSSPSKRYVFFDTETTGVPAEYNAPTSNTENWPRLVQLSWIVQDEKGDVISREGHIIKPEGFVIPEGASQVHGITTSRALIEGEDLEKVLNKFLADVKRAEILVCHNAGFDKSIVGCECIRVFGSDPMIEKEYRDTMLESVRFCALPPYRNGEYKWPKLQELHNKLFGCNFDDAHNSDADVEATAKCFWELVRRGVINA